MRTYEAFANDTRHWLNEAGIQFEEYTERLQNTKSRTWHDVSLFKITEGENEWHVPAGMERRENDGLMGITREICRLRGEKLQRKSKR
jgi:hypothetical protein